MLDSPPEFRTLLERFREGVPTLPDKPDETPEATLNALWAKALGQSLSIRQAEGFVPTPLDPEARRRLESLVHARLGGTPLAHLTGRQDFMGIVLLASPAALLVRRETELLGYSAVDRARRLPDGAPLIVDVCTGSGNLALGLASHLPGARVHGSDLSPEAIELAKDNARFVGREDVEFRRGDLLDPFREPAFRKKVDLLVCNPPYISSGRVDTLPLEIRMHEPRLAFDGGPFGIELLWRLIDQAPDVLRPGGWLLVEVGAGQGPQAERLLRRARAFDPVEPIADASGELRVLAGRRVRDDRNPSHV